MTFYQNISHYLICLMLLGILLDHIIEMLLLIAIDSCTSYAATIISLITRQHQQFDVFLSLVF
jgi:hypothetical protein